MRKRIIRRPGKPRVGAKFTQEQLGELKRYELPQSRGGGVYYQDMRGLLYQKMPDGKFIYVGQIKI